MAKTVKITTDNKMSVVDVPWDLDGWEKAIDADCTDRVKTQLMLDLFGEMVVMIVDDSGLCKGLPKNQIASFLYGCGCPIAGDVIFGVMNGPDILPPEDAGALMQTLKCNFSVLIEAKESEARE